MQNCAPTLVETIYWALDCEKNDNSRRSGYRGITHEWLQVKNSGIEKINSHIHSDLTRNNAYT